MNVKFFSRILIATIFVLTSSLCFANQYPINSSVPGGVAVIPLNIHAATPPVVYYRKRRALVIRKDQSWAAVIGIPLYIKPGQQQITVKGGHVINFTVKDKQYKTQYLTIKNKRKVTPNKLDTRRINQEHAEINRVLSGWTDVSHIQLHFELPLIGRISSPFGLRRVYNDKPRSPHSGLDIARPSGTPILSASSGRVVNTGNYFYTGNTVYVNHGEGLYTMYCHLSKIKVHTGQNINAGHVIGLVGATGRVTGPHLHWSVILNGARVDPVLFISPKDYVLLKSIRRPRHKKS